MPFLEERYLPKEFCYGQTHQSQPSIFVGPTMGLTEWMAKIGQTRLS